MQYVNLYANKMLEDVVACCRESSVTSSAQLQGWLGYIKHGDSQRAKHDELGCVPEKTPQHFDRHLDTQSTYEISKVDRYAAQGARAGYLVGCALTSTTDLLFGTPETTSQSSRQRKSRPAHDGVRVGFGVFRPKPAVDPVELSEGLVGCAYARIANIVQWLGGNVGAVAGATGFALLRGVQYGARRLGHLLFARSIAPVSPLAGQAFKIGLQRVAQRADVVGVAVFGLPLYFAFGLSIGGALLVSASLKGVSAGVGALIGTGIAGVDYLFSGDKQLKQGARDLWRTCRAWTRASAKDAIDVLDEKAGLHRAKLAAAKREINPDDVLEVLELHHERLDS